MFGVGLHFSLLTCCRSRHRHPRRAGADHRRHGWAWGSGCRSAGTSGAACCSARALGRLDRGAAQGPAGPPPSTASAAVGWLIVEDPRWSSPSSSSRRSPPSAVMRRRRGGRDRPRRHRRLHRGHVQHHARGAGHHRADGGQGRGFRGLYAGGGAAGDLFALRDAHRSRELFRPRYWPSRSARRRGPPIFGVSLALGAFFPA